MKIETKGFGLLTETGRGRFGAAVALGHVFEGRVFGHIYGTIRTDCNAIDRSPRAHEFRGCSRCMIPFQDFAAFECDEQISGAIAGYPLMIKYKAVILATQRGGKEFQALRLERFNGGGPRGQDYGLIRGGK